MRKKNEMLAGVLGTLLQWYDFSLFAFLAPVIAKTFFSSASPFVALLNTFVVFAVGYFLSPLGAVFFGYLGDRYGRKVALTWSIMLMTVPTLVIAVLPGFDAMGWLSPLLLLLCRLLQGFVASAEFAGSAIFMLEHAPKDRQCFYSSLTSSSYSLGMILGAVVCSWLVLPIFPAWAWRLAFAFAAIGAVLVLFLRTRVKETTVFIDRVQADSSAKCAPLMQAWHDNKMAILRVLGLSWMVGVVTFGSYVFMNSYLVETTSLHLSTAIRYVTYALVLDAVIEPLVAMVADRWGKRRVMVFGGLMLLILLPGIFTMMHFNNAHYALWALLTLSLCIAITFSPVNALMALLFKPRYRFSGFATAFNVGISVFGGTTPLVLLALVHHGHRVWGMVGYYALACLVGLWSLYGYREADNQ